MGMWENFKRIMNGEESYEDTAPEENEIPFNDNTAARREARPTPPADNLNVEPMKHGNQVVLVKPERFDDAVGVADHLNAKRTVVLNLESANKDIARRILDFLSGVAYANDGQIKKVANCTFIIIPYNVGIMGDLLDELENNGLYF